MCDACCCSLFGVVCGLLPRFVRRGCSSLLKAVSLPLAISCLLCNRWCVIFVVLACCCLLVFLLEFGCR